MKKTVLVLLTVVTLTIGSLAVIIARADGGNTIEVECVTPKPTKKPTVTPTSTPTVTPTVTSTPTNTPTPTTVPCEKVILINQCSYTLVEK